MMVRPAKPEELPYLQAKLAQRAAESFEQFPIGSAVVFVAEDYDGILAGMVCLRLRIGPINSVPCWFLEPLILFPIFLRYSPAHSQRKATYLLARAAEAFVLDRARNTSGVHTFFCYIENRNKPMHGLARHIGWNPVKGKLYVKE